jgi:CDP-paratose 2-epimerase
MGGPGQFGKIDQGIFSFWVYSAAVNRPLSYIGFGGTGKQVRDCVLPEDVADVVLMQMSKPRTDAPKILNIGGGIPGSLSLLETTGIIESYFKRSMNVLPSTASRQYDIAYYVTDIRRAGECWGWKPSKTGEEIVLELCRWTTDNLSFVRALFS